MERNRNAAFRSLEALHSLMVNDGRRAGILTRPQVGYFEVAIRAHVYGHFRYVPYFPIQFELDWLLIYTISDFELRLVRLGTHSE